MKFAIVKTTKNEFMIKVWDDFILNDGDNEGTIITLKRKNVERLANEMLKEIRK